MSENTILIKLQGPAIMVYCVFPIVPGEGRVAGVVRITAFLGPDVSQNLLKVRSHDLIAWIQLQSLSVVLKGTREIALIVSRHTEVILILRLLQPLLLLYLL